MNILVTGGCGYVGSLLTQRLLEQGHVVTVVDTQWFGNPHAPHKNLRNMKLDLRKADEIPFDGVDAVLHLACVSNDPCADLDPLLSWDINVLGTMQLCDRAVAAGVKQFVYASSGSVYGISDEPNVTEDIPLRPISVYNRTKICAERIVLSYSDKMIVQVVRPGTVCGCSPHTRLDLIVNMFTMQALKNGKITVMGGDMQRPPIHIDDMVNVYLFMLEKGKSVTGIYNASGQNISIMETAQTVTKHVPAEITIAPSNDPRSYRMCSDKLIAAGFAPKKRVEDAVKELVAAYKAGKLKDEDSAYNVRWLKMHPPVNI